MANEFKVKNGLIVVGDLTTSGTITINGALAATQSWVTSQAYLTSASLSGYATQSYVTSAISALVDAAPAALDTLNELAAALGDDASFSTTVTNSIASKLSLTGGTLTGALNGTSASFSSNVTLGNNADLVFQDLAGTFPTTGKGFDWTLNNDGARIYAVQPGSDSIDLVFQLRDNATTNDRFVFWVDEWQGPAYDKYPLIISGGTEFDLKDSSLYTNTVLRLSNSGVLQNVTGNISMFTNNAGYLTSYTETDTLATVTGRGATTNTSITVGHDLTVQADGGSGYTASRLWLNSHNNYRGAGVHMSGTGSTWFAGTPYTDFDGGYVIARTGTSNDQASAQYSNALLTVKSSGNIGIGTTAPTHRLTVAGGNVLMFPSDNTRQLSFFSDSYGITASSGLELITGDYIRFRQGSTELARLTTTGLGIGTTSPSAKIHIVPTGTQVGLIADGTSVTAATANKVLDVLYNGGSSAFSVRSNGLVYIGYDSMYVEGAGITRRYWDSRIQFGTADLSSSTTGANVEVYGGLKVFRNVSNSSTPEIFRITNGGNVGIKVATPTATLSLGTSSYDNNPLAGLEYSQVTGGGRLDLKVQTWGTGSDYGLSTGLTVVTPAFDTNNVRVGIGTTSPDEKLQVAGNIKIQNETGLVTDYGPLVGRYNTSQVYVGTGGSYSIVKIGRDDGGALNVLSGGNVGIGTISPGAKLHVAGNAWINRPSNKVDNAGATELGPRVEFNNSFASGQSGYVIFRYPTYNNFLISSDYDGNVGGAIPNIQFGKQSTVYLHMNSSDGNIGIGTTSPIYKLQVAGSTYVNGGTLFIDSGQYLRWGNSNQGIVGVNDSHVAIVSGGATRQTVYADGRTYFPGLDLSISNINGSHGSGTYFRGDGSHFVFGLSDGNTLYLNYGNSSGILRTFGTWYHESTQILSTSRVLTNVSGNISMFTNDAGYLTSVSDVWVNTSGDTMTGALTIQGGWASTILDGDNVVLRKPNYSAGGWARTLLNFQEYDTTSLFQIGGYGSNNVMTYGYLGSAYNTPTIKWYANKNVYFSGNILIDDAADNNRYQKGATFLNLRDPWNNLHLSTDSIGGNYIDANVHYWRPAGGASYWMTLNGGNLGIGTTSPSAKLEISGFSTGAGLKLNYGNSSGTIEAVNFIANGGANGVIGMQMVSAGVGDLWLGGSGGRTLTLYRDGNVGIGTTDPTSQMSGTFGIGIYNALYPAVGFKNSTTAWLWYGQDSTFRMWNATFGDILTANTSGNIGIGTGSPSTKLDVNGVITATGGNSTNWNTAFGWGNHASYSYATTSYVTTQINNLINGAPGVLDTLDELAAALGDDSNFATTVTNSIAGKVSKAGDTMTGNLTLAGGTNILFTGGSHAIAGNNTGYLHFYDYTNVYFNNQLVIRGGIQNDGGNVLIDDNLNVAGELAFPDGGGAYTNIIRAAAYPSEGYPAGLNFWMEYRARGGHHFILNTDGGVGAGLASMDDFVVWQGAIDGNKLLEVSNIGNLWIAGSLTEASSLKLKENVETSEGNLEKVVNLRPVTYNKIGSQTTELGLIAEEVAEVYPEFVQYDENGEPIGVNYSRLTAALIGAVKELTNQVQELNKKING